MTPVALRFRLSRRPGLAAMATLTMMAWTNAACPPPCGRVVMSVPGTVLLEARRLTAHRHRSGRGRVLTCPSCRELVEVIEHGRSRP